jgi:hypothetical protein
MAITETIPSQKVAVDGAPALASGLPVTGADCHILQFLDETGGYLTRRVAEMTVGGGRANTAAVGRDLRRMEDRGLVDRLDSAAPVCWRRTPAGTRMLARAKALGLIAGEGR